MRYPYLILLAALLGCEAEGGDSTTFPPPDVSPTLETQAITPTPEVEPTPDPLVESGGLSATPVLTQPGDGILYQLDWSWEGATWNEAEGIYVFKTDLGYWVGLRAAYLGSWSLEAIPCVDFQARPTDHSNDPDTSYLVAPRVESVYDPGVMEFGVGISSGYAYCGVHILVAPMVATAGDGFEMDHWSTYLEGWYTVPGGEERVDFEASVNLSGGGTGELYLFSEPSSNLSTSWGQSVAAVMTVYRFPAHALDGVVLDQVSPVELAWQFQLGLTTTTRVVAQLAASSPAL